MVMVDHPRDYPNHTKSTIVARPILYDTKYRPD